MSYIEDFKTKIGQIVFQNQLKSNKRKKEVCNLENAKSVGILYEATTEDQIQQIQPFVSYFFDLRKEVKALGYVNAKRPELNHSCPVQTMQSPSGYYMYVLPMHRVIITV